MALTGWDVVILGVAAYFAAMSLVKMMQRHHNQFVGELRDQIQNEQARQKLEQRRKRKEQRARDAA